MKSANDNLLDPELQTVMGPERCRDLTAPELPGRKTVSRKDPVDASWAPARPEPGPMEKLKACAKYATIYGGLILLVFYWQETGLMAPTVAVPSMLACGVIGGMGIGRNTRR